MANYSLVVNSTYDPFTFDEMLKPALMYKQEYDALESGYGQIQDKADKFKYLSETLPEGSKARRIYEGYAGELNAYADAMLREGLTMDTRSGLAALRRRYPGEIGRIEQADTLRKAQIAEQQKALLQNPTMLFSRDARISSIDDYLDNPELSYTPYSGALLTQRVAAAASALSKSLTEYKEGKPLDKFTNTWIQKHGFSPSEVAQAINNPEDPSSSKVLNAIVENTIASTPIPQWGDKATLDQAYRYAREGLWQSVGQTQVSQYENYGARLAAQMEKEKAMADYKQRQAEAQAKKAAARLNLQGLPGRRAVRTQKERDQKASNIVNFKQYFDWDGKQWRMNEKGREAYWAGGEGVLVSVPDPNASWGRDVKMPKNSDFREFIDSIGGAKYMGRKEDHRGYQAGNLGNLWTDYNKEVSMADTKTGLEYTKNIDPTNYDNVVAALNGARSRDGEITNYQMIHGDDGYKFLAGDSYNVSELATSDIKSAQVIFGSHGNYLEVKLKDGDTVRYPVSSYSTTYGQLMQNNAAIINAYKQALADGKVVAIDPDTGDYANIETLINKELIKMGENGLSSLGVSQVKPETVEQGMR